MDAEVDVPRRLEGRERLHPVEHARELDFDAGQELGEPDGGDCEDEARRLEEAAHDDAVHERAGQQRGREAHRQRRKVREAKADDHDDRH